MTDSDFAQRMFLALLAYQGTLGRRVTQGEVGEAVAKRLKRPSFTAAAVSRHFTGKRDPDREEIVAYAEVMGVDPGWLAFGPKSKAPAPNVTAAQLAEFAPGSKRGKRQA